MRSTNLNRLMGKSTGKPSAEIDKPKVDTTLAKPEFGALPRASKAPPQPSPRPGSPVPAAPLPERSQPIAIPGGSRAGSREIPQGWSHPDPVSHLHSHMSPLRSPSTSSSPSPSSSQLSPSSSPPQSARSSFDDLGFSPISGSPKQAPSPEPGPGRVRFAAAHEEHDNPGWTCPPTEDLGKLIKKNRKAVRQETESMAGRFNAIVEEKSLSPEQKKAGLERVLKDVSAEPETHHLIMPALEELGEIRRKHSDLVDEAWLAPLGVKSPLPPDFQPKVKAKPKVHSLLGQSSKSKPV